MARPETYAQLVSRLNAGCFFVNDKSTPPARVKKSRELLKILRAVRSFTAEEAEVFLELLNGERVLVDGQYACKRTLIGWLVYSMSGDEHTVNVNFTACSCPDSRLRGRECKHCEALKCYFRVT